MTKPSEIRSYGAAVLAASILASPTLVLAAAAQPVAHHTAVAKAPSAFCSSLASDYETASKKLSLSAAQAERGRHAAQTDDAAIVSQAWMTMSLMQAHSCKLPSSAPSPHRYEKNAVLCERTEEVAANQAELDEAKARFDGSAPQYELTDMSDCNMANWHPD